jgi:ATP-dependent Clp protease adapter protein ClpS
LRGIADRNTERGAWAVPSLASADVAVEEDVAETVGRLFDGHYAVIILDSDFTTFAEVEGACIELFGFTPEEAAALSMKVHTSGEALAAVLPEAEARRAVHSLRARNVRARMERL